MYEDKKLHLNSIADNERLQLKQYLKQDHIKEYFEMLANKIFNKIPSSLREVNLFTRWGSFVQI